MARIKTGRPSFHIKALWISFEDLETNTSQFLKLDSKGNIIKEKGLFATNNDTTKGLEGVKTRITSDNSTQCTNQIPISDFDTVDSYESMLLLGNLEDLDEEMVADDWSFNV